MNSFSVHFPRIVFGGQLIQILTERRYPKRTHARPFPEHIQRLTTAQTRLLALLLHPLDDRLIHPTHIDLYGRFQASIPVIRLVHQSLEHPVNPHPLFRRIRLEDGSVFAYRIIQPAEYRSRDISALDCLLVEVIVYRRRCSTEH